VCVVSLFANSLGIKQNHKTQPQNKMQQVDKKYRGQGRATLE
jgi:hypothetical protein